MSVFFNNETPTENQNDSEPDKEHPCADKYNLLDNYEYVNHRIIKQSVVEKVKYDYDYSNKYNSYGEKGNYLGFLRLGILIGSIGHIPESVMDVGYGNGSFLQACKTIVKNECYGSDIHNTYPLPEGCSFVDNIFNTKVEVITFFDSLEHFDDIFIIDKLQTDYIMISVPWCHYVSTEWFKEWVHRRPNEHLWHFNSESLISFFESYGYICLHVSNSEDAIRKRDTYNDLPNILTCVFKRI
jgi:Methyltransferase domain